MKKFIIALMLVATSTSSIAATAGISMCRYDCNDGTPCK